MGGNALIEDMLAEIERQSLLLEELAKVPKDEFIREPRTHLLAERCFQLAIQCVLDVCNAVISRHGWTKPRESGDSIRLLGTKGVYPESFARRIEGMAGFRNILVHAYLHINRETVHSKLTDLGDFREFSRHVLAHLSCGGSGGGAA